MRVNPLKSIAATTFFVMLTVVLLTITGNSLQNGLMFRKVVQRQIEDDLIVRVGGASRAIETMVEEISGQFGVLMHYMAESPGIDHQRILKGYLSSSTAVAAVAIVADAGAERAVLDFAMTANVHDARFEEIDPASVEKILRKEVTGVKSASPERQWILKDLSSVSGLPLLAIATRYTVAITQQTIWGVIIIWQSSLAATLPHSDYIEAALFGDEGRMLAATSIGPNIFPSEYVQKIVASTVRTGFSAFTLGEGRYLSAYERLPGLAATVLLRRDADVAELAVMKVVARSALWALAFLLVAILLSYFLAGGITKDLREISVATVRIARGDFAYKVKPKGANEIAMLGSSVNDMSSQIERLLIEREKRVQLEHQLETARVVQSTFFPLSAIDTGTLQIAAHYRPADQCCGDWWGRFRLSDDRELICIADAMGHGAPAALVTAMAYSTCSILARTEANRLTAARLLEHFNRSLFDAVQGSFSMTFFAAILDRAEGAMTFSSAAHNPPLMVSPATADAACKTQWLGIGGMPLGIVPDVRYKEQRVVLRPGEKLVLYTDGVIECQAASGVQWGKRNLVRTTVAMADRSAEALRDHILKKVALHIGDGRIEDDITLLVIEPLAAWFEKDSSKTAA